MKLCVLRVAVPLVFFITSVMLNAEEYPAKETPKKNLEVATKSIPHDIKIKVLLNEYPNKKNASPLLFKISTEKTLSIRIGQSQRKTKKNGSPGKIYSIKKTPKKACSIDIMVKKGVMYARCGIDPFKKIKFGEKAQEISFKSRHPIVLNGKQYIGIIKLKLLGKKLYLINKLDLEDYVYAVLRAEIYPNWPHGMQKIQAIVSRTYAVHQMLVQKKRKNKLPYDIKRSTFHQRYNGNHNYRHLMRAVNETRGLILTHRDEVVLTMFDACCGGSIPAHMKGIHFEKAPYLARNTPCRYCKNYGLYRWKRKIPVKKFLHSLNTNLNKKIRMCKEIIMKERDRAGIVHKVEIVSKKRRFCIKGKDLWMSMPNVVRSQNFSIKTDGAYVYINGKGFGHQIGLCQRGARELVKKGQTVRKILGFFYPNTTIAKLKIERNDARV